MAKLLKRDTKKTLQRPKMQADDMTAVVSSRINECCNKLS